MPADFKASIRFNPDVKPSEPQYKVSCKQLGIVEEGSGNIREMMDDIEDLIREEITKEFRSVPRSVQLVGYSMNLEFSVIGPVNRSLAEFEGEYSATVRLADGTEIPLEQLTTTAQKVIDYAKRTGKTPEQVLAEAKAELNRRKKGSEGVKS